MTATSPDGTDACPPVSVTRRIVAPASEIFAILADPANHPGIDGSRMLRDGGSGTVLTGVGDTFVMPMHRPDIGEYSMLNRVVKYEPERLIAWAPTPGNADVAAAMGKGVGESLGYTWEYALTPDGPHATVVTETYECSGASRDLRAFIQDGRIWTRAMAKTLDRLAARAEHRDAP